MAKAIECDRPVGMTIFGGRGAFSLNISPIESLRNYPLDLQNLPFDPAIEAMKSCKNFIGEDVQKKD
jgi:hypothetical protein